MNSKFNKLFSFALITTLIGTTLHCSATNIVPVNGGNGNVAVPPAAPVSTSMRAKNSAGAFSLQAMKSKIADIIRPQKMEAELEESSSGSSSSSSNPSGTCGDNCSWSLDTSTGELTISGTGAMGNWDDGNVPWESYENSIKSVHIGNEITSIGNRAFQECSVLTSITIPASVTTVGAFAFAGCSALTSITIGNSVTSIDIHAFALCSTLTSITIPASVVLIESGAFTDCKVLSHVCYLGTSDPGENSAYVFDGCGKLERVSVTKDYTSSSFCGEQISKVDKCVTSSATLSAKPVIWAIAATACLVPTVIFSFLM